MERHKLLVEIEIAEPQPPLVMSDRALGRLLRLASSPNVHMETGSETGTVTVRSDGTDGTVGYLHSRLAR